MDDLDKLEDDFEKKFDDFRKETIREYKTKIAKYSLIVKNKNASTSDYADLFVACRSLYKFTKNEKGGPLISKDKVDKLADKLLVLIKKDITEGTPAIKAKAYCCLSYICVYRNDKQRALECYNKAVSLDKTFLSERADFKNVILNDKEGALADYHEALSVATDPATIDSIKFSIEHIDTLRDVDKSLKEVKWGDIKLLLFLILSLVIIALRIFSLFSK